MSNSFAQSLPHFGDILAKGYRTDKFGFHDRRAASEAQERVENHKF